LREVGAVAAMSQCLVEWLNTLMDRGYTLPLPRTWIVRENKWRAARHGIDAKLVMDDKGTLSPVRTEVRQLVEELAPVASRLGCDDDLQYAHVMAERPSYMRQRDIVQAGGSLVDVVDSLITELRTNEVSKP
jgi:carboxylate-amine ligase